MYFSERCKIAKIKLSLVRNSNVYAYAKLSYLRRLRLKLLTEQGMT